MFFTQSGRCYVEKVYEIPEMSRSSKGRSIANILELRSGGKDRRDDPHPVKGQRHRAEYRGYYMGRKSPCHLYRPPRIVKKSNLSDFKNIRKGGIIAVQIEEGDKLIDAKLTSGQNEILLITKDGMSIRFNEDELRDQGRNTVGVWGIRPDKGDHVVDTA